MSSYGKTQYFNVNVQTAAGPENVRPWRLNFDGGVERALQMANNHHIEQFLYLHPPLKTAKVRATISAAYGTVYNWGMEHIWFYLAYYKRVRETAREKKGKKSVLNFLPFRKYKEGFWPNTISTPTMSYG